MKFRTIIIVTVSYLLFVSCGDVPVFTEMDTNRLKVIIKGTFETEDVSNFVSMPSANSPLILTKSIVDGEFPASDDTSTPIDDGTPTTFMFDIAELRLNGNKFANYRQVIEAPLLDSESFFNQTGIVLDNDDPAEGYYDTVQIYARKMIFDGANIYRPSGNTFEHDKQTQVIFHEDYRAGFDFNQFQQNTYVDSLRENSRSYLRSFPIKIPIIGGLQYDKNNKETVLEIRFVVKNFIKKYELPFYDSGTFKVYHFYALSDWLRSAEAGDRVFGGNILAVARAYVPGKTGRVTVTGLSSNQYVIAIPASENIDDYYMDRSKPAPKDGLRGFDYDLPQQPVHPGNNIEALLDYYIKNEKYKNDWNSKLPAPPSLPDTAFDKYEEAWDDYDDAIDKFKIAPYAAYTGSGTTVTFSNMAPGEYNFYRANRPAAYGKFFEGPSSPFTQIAISISPITVQEKDTITIP
ncbi:MAG: hypothetical protein FWF73_03815 [Spirochaetes bacterium]|nr:hypothetical protein [Spirochaetota bacterium]